MRAERLVMPNDALRRAREQRGWSREELAARLETNAFTIYRWEHGRAAPSPYYRQKLMSFFAQSAAALGLVPMATVPQGTFAAALPAMAPLGDGMRGREALVEGLARRLTLGAGGTTLGLYGLPGVGKTALALELAHAAAIRAHFADGILWVGLGPNPNPVTELRHWGAALGLPAEYLAQCKTAGELSDALQRAIGVRHVLLVIDDVWNDADALPFKVGGPGCATIITTRFLPVAAHLAHTEVVRVPELDAVAGLDLLDRLAPGVVGQHAEALRPLVLAVGGLPLALTLMGHYLHAQALSGQERRVRTALACLTSAEARLQMGEVLPPTQTPPAWAVGVPFSLHGAIALSVEALSPAAQQVFHALALFPPKPNTFAEEAAYAVAGIAEGAAFLAALDEVVDAGLVEGSMTERYTLHQTIADYARLHAPPASAFQRMGAYYLAYVLHHRNASATVAPEFAAILQTIAWADGANLYETVLALTLAFAPLLTEQGLAQTAVTLLRRALTLAHEEDQLSQEVTCCTHLGEALLLLGDYEACASVLERGLRLSLADDAAVSALQFLQGRLLQQRGQMQAASERFAQLLESARRRQDQALLCKVLAHYGYVEHHLGHDLVAAALLHENLELARDQQDARQQCQILRNLGIMAGNAGDYERADTYFLEGLALARQHGYQTSIESFLINHGIVAMNLGDESAAEAAYQEGLAIAERIGHAQSVTNAYSNLAELALQQQDRAKARGYIVAGTKVAAALGHRASLCKLQGYAARLAMQEGDLEQAEYNLTSGMALAQEIGTTWFVLGFRVEWGNLALQRGDADQAIVFFTDVLEHAQAGKNQSYIAEALFGLAQAAALRQEHEESFRLGQESFQIFTHIRHVMRKQVQQWLMEHPPALRHDGTVRETTR